MKERGDGKRGEGGEGERSKAGVRELKSQRRGGNVYRAKIGVRGLKRDVVCRSLLFKLEQDTQTNRR